ncbi:MAG: 6,7-dimethyl-8-ribityllumazine synthase [Candidatus Omnitrophota bacterium]
MKEIKVDLMGKGKSFALVVSRFNEFISAKLLDGARDTLVRHGVSEDDLTLVWVPGSFEIPIAAQRLARSKKFDAVICLGTVIRGATPHFDFIAGEVAKGIAKISLDGSVPCVFGVITSDTLEQAIERAGTKSGNKGRDAAMTALEMANLCGKI